LSDIVIRPFEIEIADKVLVDLDARLDAYRAISTGGTDDWESGVPPTFLDRLVRYWRTRYEWRPVEQRLNQLPHFRTEIDGAPIHFVYQPGTGPNPLPVILTHGWPWTFDDYSAMIGPLSDPAAHGGDPADAFDVVVPSLPGFALSSPMTRTDLNYWKTADLWVRLMIDGLGYERFGAHGCDTGALVTAQLGHRHADRVMGIHSVGGPPASVFAVDRPWADVTGGALRGIAEADRSATLAFERRFAAHIGVQSLSPQTLATGLTDSPAGLASWLIEPRFRWTDCDGDIERVFSLDDLITTVMLYWATDSFASAVRFYSNAWRYRWTPSHDRQPLVEVPTGISWFLADLPPRPSTDRTGLFNVIYENSHDRGGHFASVENPEALVEDIRATFRPLRQDGGYRQGTRSS
jgi:microsomal epoxide hydrolase